MGDVLIHYLTPDDAGPIVSEPHAGLRQMGLSGVGEGGRFRAACDRGVVLGQEHRGSGETFAANCPDCRATEAFQANAKPHPKAAERQRKPLPPPTECKT